MPTAIAITDLKKTYANGFEALKGISLSVEQGDFFALLGPNGAGKSTTIGVLSSLVKKTDVAVEIFGKNVDAHVYETKLDLGIVPQEVNFSQFEKVGDIVMTQAGYYGMPRKLAAERCEKYLRKLGLWDKRNERSRTLSGGMKRRLMIARALVHEPRLLILDEPNAGVDIELRRSMWEFLTELNESGTTIILTTHYLEEAEALCEKVAIMQNGQVKAVDKTQALLNKHPYRYLRVKVKNTNAVLVESLQACLVEKDPSGFVFQVDKNSSMAQTLSWLEQSGLEVNDVSSRDATLEEVFLDLTTQEPK